MVQLLWVKRISPEIQCGPKNKPPKRHRLSGSPFPHSKHHFCGLIFGPLSGGLFLAHPVLRLTQEKWAFLQRLLSLNLASNQWGIDGVLFSSMVRCQKKGYSAIYKYMWYSAIYCRNGKMVYKQIPSSHPTRWFWSDFFGTTKINDLSSP